MTHHKPNQANSDFLIQRISELVTQATGVKLGAKQKSMVYFRTRKRMTDLSLTRDEDYLSYVEQEIDEELPILISLLTTHHSYFFREFSQFQHLESDILPDLIAQLRAQNKNTIRIWSAACSRGQEMYSLGMFLDFYLKKAAPDMTFKIIGTDIDPESVEIARNGVYRWDEIKQVPAYYLQNFWSRGTGEISEYVKVKKNLKSHCEFKSLNLFEIKPDTWADKFDIIFCRNVFIYFDEEQIKSATQSLLQHMNPAGVLYIGLSESLNGMKLPLKLSGPSAYRVPQAEAPKKEEPAVPATPRKAVAKGPIRVLCVDDSSTILVMLKKILAPEFGFEIAGLAMNGFGAADFLKKQTVDVITLDIHMPEQNGLEFLESMRGTPLPPVVVISSVSREDSNLGLRMLDLGASDYVEKPSMQSLQSRSEEIRNKVKMAAVNRDIPVTHKLDHTFSRKMALKNPSECARILIGGLSHKDKLVQLIKELQHTGSENPPIWLLLHGAEPLLPVFCEEMARKVGLPFVERTADAPLETNKIYYSYFSADRPFSIPRHIRKTSLMVLGDLSEALIDKIHANKDLHILVEDLGDYRSSSYVRLRLLAARSVPLTSFEYHSSLFLSGGGS